MSNKTTSQNVGSKAAAVLSSSTTSAVQKRLAASALAQTNTNKTTSTEVAKTAAEALQRSSSAATTKTLAGSVLRAANKTLLASLPDLAVLLVLSAVVRLARIAALGFVSHSKSKTLSSNLARLAPTGAPPIGQQVAPSLLPHWPIP